MPAEQIVKLKKKQWYQIIAPKHFDNVVLGETLVYDPKEMLGKTLSHSLMSLTNDVKKQNINIHFKITDVEGEKAKTTVMGYEIVPSSVRRFIRRNSEKIDLSFNCETSEGIFLRVKILIVTKGSVKGSIAAKLRNFVVSFLSKTIKKITYEELLSELISRKLQALMRENLTKIYPLKVCEIRYLGIEAREKTQEVKAVVKEENK